MPGHLPFDGERLRRRVGRPLAPFVHLLAQRLTLAAGLAAALATAACAGGDDASTVVRTDSAGVAIVENPDRPNLPACSLASSPRVAIGQQTGEEAYQLYRVFGATRLSDGTIALVNQGSQQLRLYDADGRVIRAAGREGGGPGEFRDAFYLWRTSGDTLYVGDYRPWRFLVFTPAGEWVRTVTPEPRYPNVPDVIGVLDDGRSVIGEVARAEGRGPDFAPRTMWLLLHERDGAAADTIGSWQQGRYGRPVPEIPMFVYPFFEAFTHAAVGRDRIVLSTAHEPELLEMGPDGRLRRVIRWRVDADREVTDAHVEARRDELREQYADLDPAMAKQMLEPLVTAERPAADRFPVLRGILLGTEGRIWVREYRRPGEPEGDHWLAFDPGGRLVCRLATPPDLDEYEFGPDYLLGKAQDDMDVERVVLYGLETPDAALVESQRDP